MTQSYLQASRGPATPRPQPAREGGVAWRRPPRSCGTAIRVGIGGSTMSRTPMAMIWALIRAGKHEPRLLALHRLQRRRPAVRLRHLQPHDHQLVQPGHPLGRLQGDAPPRREAGKIRYDEWSHMAIGMRFRAGAMGIPFMPIRSMLGSDVARIRPEAKEMTCPFTGEKLLLVPALNPDVALDPRAALRPLRQRADRRAAIHGHRSGDGGQQGRSSPPSASSRTIRSGARRTRPRFPSSASMPWSKCRSAARRTNATASMSR